MRKEWLHVAFFLVLGWHCGTNEHIDPDALTQEARPVFDTDAIVGRWVAMWTTYDLAQVPVSFTEASTPS